ncbi:MAG: hypothetical protein ABEJ72_02195 [Candidatus Aenigmatarchaeota archaeon]
MTGSVKICPECASREIEMDRRNWLGFIGQNPTYNCKECGYSGSIVLEIDEDKADDAKKALDDSEEVVPEKKEIDMEINRVKLITGFVFLLMGVPLLYAPLTSDFIIGIITSFFGVSLVHMELRKR